MTVTPQRYTLTQQRRKQILKVHMPSENPKRHLKRTVQVYKNRHKYMIIKHVSNCIPFVQRTRTISYQNMLSNIFSINFTSDFCCASFFVKSLLRQDQDSTTYATTGVTGMYQRPQTHPSKYVTNIYKRTNNYSFGSKVAGYDPKWLS